ncbi:response regulator transcription factor [Phaeobacter sp.]|uniref:helix-turn-helix transcriptional regulator n=1 Tax=Phaeobacter sp. TaxID=1902409 RepID=UPI0025D5DA3C|nr:response regulator transcription factor [Phaeobacter sp.]
MTGATHETQRKSVLVADDHLLLLDTLKLVSQASEFQVATCQSMKDVIDRLQDTATSYDLVLLDIYMSDMDGMKSIVEIVKQADPVPVVLLTSSLSDQFAREAIQNGVRGYVSKRSKLRNLCDVIKVVINGGTCAPASVLAPSCDTDSVWGLSPREMSIGQLIANGLSNKLIAYELGLSEHTIKMHIRSIFRKAGASNRAQVAAALQEHNLTKQEYCRTSSRFPDDGCSGLRLGNQAKGWRRSQ